jgi:hypothetical protein
VEEKEGKWRRKTQGDELTQKRKAVDKRSKKGEDGERTATGRVLLSGKEDRVDAGKGVLKGWRCGDGQNPFRRFFFFSPS